MNKYCSGNHAGPAGRAAGASRGEAAKRGLTSVLAAPFRVHRYRDAHTRMLREALCQRDCDD